MGPSRLKIAYICTPITFGGAEKVSLNFLGAVDRGRFELHPILLTRPWEEEPYFAGEIRRLGYAFDTLPVALKAEGDPLRVPRVAWRLYRLLKQGGFDLVHAHGYFADICGLPMARLLRIPGLSTCHGFIANDRKLQAYNRLDAWSLRLCRRVLAVSEGIRGELVQAGVSPSRIEVVANAVMLPPAAESPARRREVRLALGLAQDELVIGYHGRLSAEKGLNHLVAAVAALQGEGAAVKLLLVGEGPERPALEGQAQSLGVQRQVLFAGFRANAESWLPAFDIFALPSLTEGTPMALLEAMAAGVPVIASAVGGVPRVVTDGLNGLLVPAADTSRLVAGLRRLMEDGGLRRQLGRAGRETVRDRYGIEAWCRAIEKQYQDIRGAGFGARKEQYCA